MKAISSLIKIISLLLLVCTVHVVAAQNLKLTDFAVWGGGSSPGTYNSTQGVFIKNAVHIQGNIGSNHLVNISNNLTLHGNVYSGNRVLFSDFTKVTGNIFANRLGTTLSPAISGNNRDTITGNLTANGRIAIRSGKITGQVAVPAPSGINYSGPAPSAGVVTTFTLPVMPVMPTNTPFDNQVGTATITTTQVIAPGRFRKLALNGNQTVTLNGPGNYIFYEVDNGTTTNKLVFDFNNTLTGTINIFIIKDARWGALSVSTANGNFPSRIFTEVHGTGSTFGGNAFDLRGPSAIPAGGHVWLGNVWAPNGGISVNNTIPSATPHIIGALWSGKSITLNNNLRLVYTAPAAEPSYISPYYPPPAAGKVDSANNMIGAELFSLTQNPLPAIDPFKPNEIFVLDGAGRVMIDVISHTANDAVLKGQLMALGMTDTINNGPHMFVITGFFPINKLLQLNSISAIQYVQPHFPAISNAGQVTTQGDSTMRSNIVRSRFGLDGSGVKIGVISDSYNSQSGAQAGVDQGDLPGIKSSGPPNENMEPVQVLADLAQRGRDEGRAMLEIVHDIAPKAKLAFRTGFLTAGDFARGIGELASPDLPGGRCDVIVDDLTYITEPFLRDGVVAQAVDQAVAQGVTYFSSAGNFGNKSYEAIFNGITNASLVPTGQVHKFGAGTTDIYQTLKLKPGSYTIVLQWNDEFHSLGSLDGVRTDMDLYLVGSNGFTLFGFNRSNISGDPFEVCPFMVSEETSVKLMVVRASGTANVRFKYIIFRGEATIEDYQTGSSTIVGHPNAEGAIAVGAMLYANFPAITPVWPGVASFSSRGGTVTTQSTGTGTTQRNKPEIVGPNGANTTVNLGGAVFNDGDAYPNFFGTSAAAPHIAAVGGLLIQGRRKFNLQTTVTPAEIRQQLTSSAGKFSYLTGDFSFEGGYGFAQADLAIAQIANARPIISSLEAVVPGAQTGTQPFEVRIRGNYLTNNTVIFYAGRAIETTITDDKTEARATIAAIANGQDPALQLYNPPKSPSKLDGGFSEALHFFSAFVDITIRSENKSRKYGSDNPVFTAEILYNGVPMTNQDTLAKLKLDGNNLAFTTIATVASNAGLYGIFPSRATPLSGTDPLLSRYGFTFVSGTLSVGKMPVKITPVNKTVTYGEDIGEITHTYEIDASAQPSLIDEVKNMHRKYLAGNGLIVLNGFDSSFSALDLANMSTMASFQSVRNARLFILERGRLQKLLAKETDSMQIGNQRFFIDASIRSLRNYKQDSTRASLVQGGAGINARGFLNIKALTNGNARASLPNGQLVPMVNGQLQAMVNGQLRALVNGQLKAMVNDVFVEAEDIIFQSGQLLAMVNGEWTTITNGQLQATVNGQPVTVEVTVSNGQLQAMVNGQLMALVNGQLQAMVNGQLLALVNGQLQAMVNGQLVPLVNGQLKAMVNGQLKAMVNGQLVAMVNGQLMALVNGQLELVQELTLANGQLQAMVNGQLMPMVNGQLKAMVNGVVMDISTSEISLVNGQLQAMVNGQLQAFVNGQLQAMVNGQLMPMVNGAGVAVSSVKQLANGQLQALVNGTYIPIINGQLLALVNGQLLAMVNGQLMALVNGEILFAVFQDEQLKVVVNGQLKAMVNGQLQAMVNGQLKALVNSVTLVDNSYRIVNGQLQAIVNNVEWTYANGQLLALVNGQLQALVNNFDVSGTNNNAKTLVLVDENDITLQSGDIGAMFSVNMITGLGAGKQLLIPGAFVNENWEVTYGTGQIEILKAPVIVKADDTSRVYGDPNPDFILSYSGLAYDDDATAITTPSVANTTATTNSGVDSYPIITTGGSSANYSIYSYLPGILKVSKKALIVSADNKTKLAGSENPPFTITYNGLVGDDTQDSVCMPLLVPPSPKAILQLNRTTTYTDIRLNGRTNHVTVEPGQLITLTGNYNSIYTALYNEDGTEYCPGCITQLHIGMGDGSDTNIFNDCIETNGGNAMPSGTLNRTFTAPRQPGTYYITQSSTWWLYCRQFADPIHSNVPDNAIAVVVVTGANQNISAGSTATTASPAGVYPITLLGCSSYSANYDVTLQGGTLTVQSGNTTRTAAGLETQNMKFAASTNSLYPNPATSLVRLQMKDVVQRTTDIQLFDVLGKLHTLVVKKVNENNYDITVSALLKGVYYIKVKTATGITTFKFVKM